MIAVVVARRKIAIITIIHSDITMVFMLKADSDVGNETTRELLLRVMETRGSTRRELMQTLNNENKDGETGVDGNTANKRNRCGETEVDANTQNTRHYQKNSYMHEIPTEVLSHCKLVK